MVEPAPRAEEHVAGITLPRPVIQCGGNGFSKAAVAAGNESPASISPRAAFVGGV